VSTGYIDYKLPANEDYISICTDLANEIFVENLILSSFGEFLFVPDDNYAVSDQ